MSNDSFIRVRLSREMKARLKEEAIRRYGGDRYMSLIVRQVLEDAMRAGPTPRGRDKPLGRQPRVHAPSGHLEPVILSR